MKNTDVKDKAEQILNQGYVCNHCLGRQFGQLLTGYTNDRRGEIIRSFLAFSLDAGEDLNVKDVNFKDFDFREYDCDPEEEEYCIVCNNFFEGQIEFFVDEAVEQLEDLEYDNFLVGTKVLPELIKNEEELWEKVGIEYCEPLKSEINREVGRRLEEKLDKEANFKRPDVVVMLDIEKQEVEVDINSICFYAEYDKLKRGIPQSKWPSGKFETSVEEIIAEPFMEETKGSGHKFHASGREDIDALCEGRRPFIIQILEPKNRELNLEDIEERVNERDEVQIYNLHDVSYDTIPEMMEWRPDKTYEVMVETEEEIKDDNLERLNNLIGVINQETPSRVKHRRADRLRKREVKSIDWKKLSDKKLKLTVRTEAGTYVKELVSSDGGRTYPSVKEMLKTECEPKDLIVKDIHSEKYDKP